MRRLQRQREGKQKRCRGGGGGGGAVSSRLIMAEVEVGMQKGEEAWWRKGYVNICGLCFTPTRIAQSG